MAVTAHLFDQQKGEKVDSWENAYRHLKRNEVLWVDLANASEDEERQICKTFGVAAVNRDEVDGERRKPGLEQHDDYLRVTAVAVSDDEDPARELLTVDCFVGSNWVVTAHDAEIAALEDFRDVVCGKGQIGRLDAPSFLAALLEWAVASYLRAFDEIEATLEEFDVSALAEPTYDPDDQIEMLVEARRRVGGLRRALAPHREVFAALSHSEFDPISSDKSAARFAELTSRLDVALASARDAKDGIASSFDVLFVRTEHRTNEIMRVLTIASILLLPGALIAGLAGMNVTVSPRAFTGSAIFWFVIAAILLIALSTLGLARKQRWI